MKLAFLSETVKLRQRAYWFMVAAMVALMAVSMVMSVDGAGDTPSDRGPAGLVLSLTQLAEADGLARSLGNAVTFLGVIVLTLVAVNVGAEYDNGVIRNLLVRQPHRTRLFLGKTSALMAFLAAATAATSVAGIAIAHLLAPPLDVGQWLTLAGLADTATGVGGLVVSILGWATLGLLCGILFRSAPAAIGVGVAYALPVEILLTVVSEDAARWLPGQMFEALARGGTPHIDHTTALAGTLVWACAATITAMLVFRTRDVTE